MDQWHGSKQQWVLGVCVFELMQMILTISGAKRDIEITAYSPDSTGDQLETDC